jgi:CHAT domain-containing protein
LSDSGQNLADGGISSFNSKMEMLGRQLITPVADLLKEKIYLIPAGPLLSLPLDATRLNGKHLFERFTVLNLVSFPSNPGPSLSVKTGPLNNVFVAGYPQDYSSDYATRLNTSAEISVVADIFVGPGLHIIQGVALLPDEFQSEQFQQANLMHLAMPGVIDLKFPGRSNLELSGSEFSSGREMLLATDIRSQSSAAELVFLSATEVTERPNEGFTSYPGLVTDFLDAGVRSVIASQWASSGEAKELFIAEFYRLLEDSGNVVDALQAAKLKYLSDNHENGLFDATGFQLYIQ